MRACSERALAAPACNKGTIGGVVADAVCTGIVAAPAGAVSAVAAGRRADTARGAATLAGCVGSGTGSAIAAEAVDAAAGRGGVRTTAVGDETPGAGRPAREAVLTGVDTADARGTGPARCSCNPRRTVTNTPTKTSNAAARMPLFSQRSLL